MMEMGVSLLWILSTTDLVIYCPVPYLLLTWRGVKERFAHLRTYCVHVLNQQLCYACTIAYFQ